MISAGKRKHHRLIAGIGVIAIAAAVLSLLTGSAPIALDRLIAALGGHGDRIASIILFELRLPRTVLSLSIGAILGLAGAALQGYLRNPLAEPSVLGVSNAAALGAVVTLYFGLADAHPAVLPLAAILGAMLALGAVFVLAARSASALTLILAGIAIGTLAGAGISLALNLSPNPFAAMEITGWLLGSLENRSTQHLWIALPSIMIGFGLLIGLGRALDALALGEATAQSLGVHPARLRLRLLAGVTVGVGAAVAVSGAIAFIGLIVPHIVRPLTDRLPSSSLLPSAIAGAALLTMADTGVRLIATAGELKLGVVTAFLGVPVFMLHLLRVRRLG